MKIEQAAARKQARIDSKRDLIIGLNSHSVKDNDKEFDLLEINNIFQTIRVQIISSSE